ncbi:super-infection exclusion protein B [Celerinatantimonas sp. YJH-8]|uniref:super-infection exclusion protein B n=1 Tax=Celerinatantimonas sp. YJH-8 TaxID=3228714 RepID=UPI0038CA60D8
MRWLKQILARFKFFETLLAWIGFSCGLLLLIPRSYFPESVDLVPYLLGLWCAMLSCASYFLGRLFIYAWKIIGGRWQLRVSRRNIEALIQCLDHTEKAILREFVISRRSVLRLPVTEPAVANLLHNGVLELVEYQQLLDQHNRVDCMISLMARPLLSYRVLSLPVGNLTEEQLERLKKMRPRFLQPDYDANRTYSGKVFRIRTSYSRGAEGTSATELDRLEHHQAAS